MSEHTPTADYAVIWLEAECADQSCEGRQWCQDNIWEDCCSCDDGSHKPTKYVRADIADALRAALGKIADEAEEFSHGDQNAQSIVRGLAAIARRALTEA